MTEYPELFEKIDRLDREMDVQAALIESLVDKVDGLVEVVLSLDTTKGRAPRKSKTRTGSSTPSMPGEDDGHAARTD